MTSKVKDLLMDAVYFDNIFLAYCVYTAINKGIVKMTDDEEKFYSSDLPFNEIQQAIDNDSLLLKHNSVKLFTVKYNLDYALYLAKHQKEVEQLHLKLFREVPERIVEATHKKGTSIYDIRTKRNMSFYDIQEQTASFPRFCGLMESKVKKKVG